MIAIAVGAGCAFINDLFFSLSLKNHRFKNHEIVTLKQLNNIQLFLIVWIIIAEITMTTITYQYAINWTLSGALIAKIVIELVVLFTALSLRQIHMPSLLRHQNTYGHLSDSFVQHSNSMVATSVVSLTAWFFIVLITSSEFNVRVGDLGFGQTIISFVLVSLISVWIVLFLKNSVLNPQRKKNSK